jgi:hypothetical protein
VLGRHRPREVEEERLTGTVVTDHEANDRATVGDPARILGDRGDLG